MKTHRSSPASLAVVVSVSVPAVRCAEYALPRALSIRSLPAFSSWSRVLTAMSGSCLRCGQPIRYTQRCCVLAGACYPHNHKREGKTMEKEHTLKILNALANGIHPATGEKFGADTPYQHPDTVRALFEAMRAVEGGSAAAPAAGPERRAALPESGSGSRWTTDEEQRLAGAFDAGRAGGGP